MRKKDLSFGAPSFMTIIFLRRLTGPGHKQNRIHPEISALSKEIEIVVSAQIMSQASEITYKTVWQKQDEKIMQQACSFWTEIGAIKEPSQGVQRSKMLCVVAYHGDKLVAVSTIVVAMQGQVHAKVCYFRCVVHPQYRRRHIATELANRCLVVSEEWSKENPKHEAMAFVIRVETPNLLMKTYQPVWNDKLNFIGYTQEGLPLYLRWFKHAYFGEKEDNEYTFYPTRPGRLGRV